MLVFGNSDCRRELRQVLSRLRSGPIFRPGIARGFSLSQGFGNLALEPKKTAPDCSGAR